MDENERYVSAGDIAQTGAKAASASKAASAAAAQAAAQNYAGAAIEVLKSPELVGVIFKVIAAVILVLFSTAYMLLFALPRSIYTNANGIIESIKDGIISFVETITGQNNDEEDLNGIPKEFNGVDVKNTPFFSWTAYNEAYQDMFDVINKHFEEELSRINVEANETIQNDIDNKNAEAENGTTTTTNDDGSITISTVETSYEIGEVKHTLPWEENRKNIAKLLGMVSMYMNDPDVQAERSVLKDNKKQVEKWVKKAIKNGLFTFNVLYTQSGDLKEGEEVPEDEKGVELVSQNEKSWIERDEDGNQTTDENGNPFFHKAKITKYKVNYTINVNYQGDEYFGKDIMKLTDKELEFAAEKGENLNSVIMLGDEYAYQETDLNIDPELLVQERHKPLPFRPEDNSGSGNDGFSNQPVVSGGSSPAPGATISAGYMSSSYRAAFGMNHKGIDFAAAAGTAVNSVGDGKVVKVVKLNRNTFKEGLKVYGTYVVVSLGKDAQNRDITVLYAHLQGANVKVGDTVKHGQRIGALGNTGYSTGPHLHFEIRANNTAIDPAPYLS